MDGTELEAIMALIENINTQAKKGKVTIPYHEKTLKPNTLKSICIQAQIDWRNYK